MKEKISKTKKANKAKRLSLFKAKRFSLFLPDELKKEMQNVSKLYLAKEKLELSLTTIMLEGARKEVAYRKSMLR